VQLEGRVGWTLARRGANLSLVLSVAVSPSPLFLEAGVRNVQIFKVAIDKGLTLISLSGFFIRYASFRYIFNYKLRKRKKVTKYIEFLFFSFCII
jgi:hypothetical protein